MRAAGSELALPRAIADGVTWLGGCLEVVFEGDPHHCHVSTYLVVGDDKAVLVDTGHPKDWDHLERELDGVLAGRVIDYIFPTHPEMPHAGNIPRLLAKYPASVVIGDTRDYHLYYPEFEDRLKSRRPGDSVELGGRSFLVTEAIVKDLPNTVWGFDSGASILFVSDGYSYIHEHDVGQCALLAEEMPNLPSAEETRFINERALYWTQYHAMSPYFDRLEALRTRLGVRIIAPAHGNVVSHPELVLPALESGYRTNPT